MSFFGFVIILVLISTCVKVLDRRRLRDGVRGDYMRVDTEELHRLRETLGDLSGRVERLEQERDFYKDLLEPLPERPRLSASDPDGSE